MPVEPGGGNLLEINSLVTSYPAHLGPNQVSRVPMEGHSLHFTSFSRLGRAVDVGGWWSGPMINASDNPMPHQSNFPRLKPYCNPISRQEDNGHHNQHNPGLHSVTFF